MPTNTILLIKSQIEKTTLQKLRRMGYVCINISLMHIVTCIDFHSMLSCMKIDKWIISSKNGVQALLDNKLMLHNTYYDKIIQKLYTKEIFVIGQKTADLLDKHGFVNITSVAKNMQTMIAKLSIKDTYAYISGDDTSFKYCIGYERLKIKRYIFYKAIAKPLPSNIYDSILYGKVSYIMLYSKRSVDIFFNELKKIQHFSINIISLLTKHIKFICISDQVANLVLSYYTKDNLPIVMVADEPNEEKMLSFLT
jgi:uroporphyrinogen-III synthase